VQRLVKPDDVRVVEQLEEPDLARQPLPLRREHDPVPVEALDGNHLPVGQPLRQLHLAKCPRPERAADAVLVRRLAGAANAAGRPAPHVRPPKVVARRLRRHRATEREEELRSRPLRREEI